MKKFIAAMVLMFPFIGGACMAGAGGMAGGCGMGGGGHSGQGGGGHGSHAQEANAPKAVPDPNFDAARTRRVLDAYDQIVVALADDKVAGVEEAAALIVKDAPNEVIKEAAAPLSVPDTERDIVEVRNQFKPLSAAVVLYAAGNSSALEAALEKDGAPMPRKAYCPMVQVAWLQQGEKITNPFYGSSMLRCGELQEWIAAH